ncbi:hypothetical protein Pla8534_00290 [Lignipirellula cremea]|uniref:Uncharacterized protein n=1 Tax=Lignipirellula cremea TaxID=2528010 RepID=A0A518DKC4_9BACT|nr:hypothetical protein Pla8534_00290 [Lignipirellula cremea]
MRFLIRSTTLCVSPLPIATHRVLVALVLTGVIGIVRSAATADEKLKPSAEAPPAIDFIVKSQHAASGGWRYQPNQSGDTSVFG